MPRALRLLNSPKPLMLCLALGCGGGGDGGTPPPTTSLAKTAGDGQAGLVGQPLATQLEVRVTENSAAASGVTVAWSTTDGGTLSPATVATDASGTAVTIWTLGTVSGSQTAKATVTDAAGSPATFTATAAPGGATTLSKAGGDGQSGDLGTQLPAPLQAKVSDEFGNGVPAVDVAWDATGGAFTSASVPTNNSGISAANLTVGNTAGPITITATAPGLVPSQVTFTATATTAPPQGSTISVANNSFSPSSLTVPVGTTVTWTWANGAQGHNVVPDVTQPATSGALANAPHTYQFTFNNPGTYRYYCANHGFRGGVGMSGTVTVQ